MDSKSVSINVGKTEKDTATIHSVPCNIDHNGPAAVNSYFNDCNKITKDEGIITIIMNIIAIITGWLTGLEKLEKLENSGKKGKTLNQYPIY